MDKVWLLTLYSNRLKQYINVFTEQDPGDYMCRKIEECGVEFVLVSAVQVLRSKYTDGCIDLNSGILV